MVDSNSVSADDLRQEWQYLNRIYIAQITHVDNVRGTVSVKVINGLGIERKNLEIPLVGFSGNGFRSSWIRYMPQKSRQITVNGKTHGGGGDLVYVGFGPQNQACILGYATQPGDYERMAKLRTSADASSRMPRADFRDLLGGEWDMRSSGGAYLFGSQDGALLMSAGPTVLARLDKQNNEIRSEAGLWKIGGTGSSLKIGDIKRLLPLGFKEKDFSVGSTLKEYNLHLETPVPLAPSLLLVDEKQGVVLDDKGIPEVSDQLVPLRYQKKIWTLPSTSAVAFHAYSNEIDANGNQSISYGETTTSVSVDATPAAAVSLDARSISTSAETTTTIDSLGTTTVSATVLAQVESDNAVQVNAPIVSLGLAPAAAANPAVHGTALLTQLAALVAGLQALANAKNPPPTFSADPDYILLQTALTEISVALALPPGTPASLLSKKVFVE